MRERRSLFQRGAEDPRDFDLRVTVEWTRHAIKVLETVKAAKRFEQQRAYQPFVEHQVLELSEPLKPTDHPVFQFNLRIFTRRKQIAARNHQDSKPCKTRMAILKCIEDVGNIPVIVYDDGGHHQTAE